MFFTSATPDAYTGMHAATFMRIAGQLAVMVERARMASELEEKRKTFETQNEELLRLNKTKDRFLGMAAHDLRNPTASILMAAEYLTSTQLDRDQRLFVRDIAAQAEYMLTLIEDLLDVSQIESGVLELSREPISTVEFVGEEVARHSALAAPKGIRIVFETDVKRGMVLADRVRMRQVMDNLLTNAVKYSPPDTTVVVRLRRHDGLCRIEVQDEGPGISPEDQEQLFSYFGRLSAVPTGGESSTGLGMAITRRIVEAHGGTIGVESQVGEGSTFWVMLPVAPAGE